MTSASRSNILRMLAERGCRLTVGAGQTPPLPRAGLQPDGVFLSATARAIRSPADYAIAAIRERSSNRHPDLRHLPGPPDLALASGARPSR